MKRIVESELLDELSPTDLHAVQSRRDLCRVNFLMGNAGHMEKMLGDLFRQRPPTRMVELGAGDGTFFLRIARKFSPYWENVEVILVDQQKLVSPETREEFQQLGWRVENICADVFDWLLTCPPVDCMLANLFLHHFEPEKLSELLRLVSAKSKNFMACEPRRSSAGIFGTKFLGLIGCNDVTRHDAVVSVRAGFRDKEISKLWPQGGDWKQKESRAGLFSHAFVAARL
ncbi:MAG: class I SAM-dependent methyltransferase [Verrucomicrobiota bacterium]